MSEFVKLESLNQSSPRVAGHSARRLPGVFCATLVLLAAELFLNGCTGASTPGERRARTQVQSVSHDYRPDGRKPILPALTTNSTLADLLTFAMLNQPKVEAAYYDWLASVERITTARSRPDPQLTFQMDIQNIVTSVMPGFMVNFPGAGKLRAAADVASAESEAKYFVFQTSVLETSYQVKRALYQLHFLTQKIYVNRATLALVSELEKLARAQNAVGKVTLQDVLRAQIEEDRLRTDGRNLEDSRESATARLSAALGLPANSALPSFTSASALESLNQSTEQLLETALTNSPPLKAIVAEIRAAEAAITLANKGRNPDFSAGLMADVKMNPVLYRPVGTVSLPIWKDKIAAQIAEGQAAKGAAQARLSSGQIELVVEFADRSVAYREAGRNLEVLEQELVPKQQQSLEVARAGYVAGQIDFFNLTDAEQTLLRFSLSEVEAREQQQMALIDLSLLAAGVTLPGGTMGSSISAMPGASNAGQTMPAPAGGMR